MKVFLDTSILIAAVIEQHTEHQRAYAILEKIQNGVDKGVISAHSLAETYSTLTTLPNPLRHSPEQALLSVQENLLDHFETEGLSGQDYAALIRDAAISGIRGGTIYDAVHLRCASKAKVQRIYTLNLKHFRAIASPKLAAILSLP